jgi:hypothetical protein
VLWVLCFEASQRISTAHNTAEDEEEDVTKRGNSIELEHMDARDGDGAAEPLIRRESGERNGDLNAGDRQRRGHEEEEDGVEFGWFIWILTFSAGVSGLLFGYEYASPQVLDSPLSGADVL